MQLGLCHVDLCLLAILADIDALARYLEVLNAPGKGLVFVLLLERFFGLWPLDQVPPSFRPYVQASKWSSLPSVVDLSCLFWPFRPLSRWSSNFTGDLFEHLVELLVSNLAVVKSWKRKRKREYCARRYSRLLPLSRAGAETCLTSLGSARKGKESIVQDATLGLLPCSLAGAETCLTLMGSARKEKERREM